MRDLWLDRETSELDSLQYFEEMRLDDELIRLRLEAKAKEAELQGEIDALLAQGTEEIF